MLKKEIFCGKNIEVQKAFEQYVGIRMQKNCVTISGKVRAFEICGIRIYVGSNLDILSIGAKFGYDPKERELEKGVSLGVGVGWNISWERVEKVECNNE